MPNADHRIELSTPLEKAVLERFRDSDGVSKFQIRRFEALVESEDQPYRDKGPYTHGAPDATGSAAKVTISEKNPTLTIDATGEGTSLEIPRTVGGANPDGFTPRLVIEGKPVIIEGGDAVLAAEGKQPARLVLNSLVENGLTKNNDGKQKLVFYRDGEKHSIVIEPGNAGLEITTGRGEQALLTISGQKPFEENKAAYDALIEANRPKEKEAAAPAAGDAPEKQPAIKADEKAFAVAQKAKEDISKQLTLVKTGFRNAPKTFPTFGYMIPLLEELRDTAGKMVPDKVVDSAQVGLFHTRLDLMIDDAQKNRDDHMQNKNDYALDKNLLETLKTIKTEMNKTPGLKDPTLSRGDNRAPDYLTEALAAVHPSIPRGTGATPLAHNAMPHEGIPLLVNSGRTPIVGA